MSTPTTMKVTVILNAGGQVAAAAKKTSDNQSGVTSELVADLGQTMIEIEVPAHVASLEGDKFLLHLAEHASIKAAVGSSASMQKASHGQEPTSGTL